MSETILKASDDRFGVLSANFRYSPPSNSRNVGEGISDGSSLRDYVFRHVSWNITNKNNQVRFSACDSYDYMFKFLNKQHYDEAMSNLAPSAGYDKPYGSSVSNQIKEYLKEGDYILKKYIEIHKIQNINVEAMDTNEKSRLSDIIASAYLSREINNYEFVILVKAKVMEMKTQFKDGSGENMTVLEYVESEMEVHKQNISMAVVEYVSRHRMYWIQNVPGFLYTLALADLDSFSTVDDDVLEYVNLMILKKYKASILQYVSVREPVYSEWVTVLSAFNEYINSVMDVVVSSGDKYYTLDRTSNSVRLVLGKLFDKCRYVAVYAGDIPEGFVSEVDKLFQDYDDSSSEIAGYLWYYVSSYISLHTDIGTLIVPKNVDDALCKRVSDDIAGMVPKKIKYPITSQMSGKLFDLDTGVVIYVKDGCRFCEDAIKKLDVVRNGENGYVKKEISSLADIAVSRMCIRNQVRALGHDTFPIIVVGGEVIGGFEELKQLVELKPK
jgi:glutaredoxin